MSDRQQYFNQAAGSWDQKFSNQKLEAFLEKFVPSFGLKLGGNVLDVGTGTGVLIPYLLKAVGSKGKIVAVDYAEKMVEICKSKYSNLPNVQVMVANVENLQFPNLTFDAVTCFGLFPHLDNKKVALAQFYRVLKPNGKLVIVHALSSSEIKSHHQNAPPAVKHDVLPSEAETRMLLQQAGFTNVNITDKQGSYLCTAIKTK